MLPISRIYRASFLLPLLAAALAACSPTFNWREVPIADTGLVALLPCKADRATRALPLGAETVTVEMAGCEAGGATFAVAHAHAANAAQAAAWQNAWRTATRAQLGAAPAAETPTAPKGAAASPPALRFKSEDAVPLEVLWFARQQPGGAVTLYQATVLGRPSAADAAATFFDGLRLP